MALQILDGAGGWFPSYIPMTGSLGSSTYVMDAAGEKAVLILQAPRAGTLDRFDFNVATVTNSPDNGLRASFQGVSATDGQNDGTILGATNNAFVTYADPLTTGWKSTNFGETVTVTRGQLIACVLDFPTFVAADSVALSSFAINAASGFPYGISVTSTKNQTNLLVVALHYTDGYAFISTVVPGCNSTTSTGNFNVNTGTADEWGMGFQVPFPCKLNMVTATISVAAGANYEVLVYDSADTVLATLTMDGDITQSSSTRAYSFVIQSELTLAINTTYRVTLRPTTTANLTMDYMGFAGDLMDTLEGGSSWYMTSRLNQGGSWTNYNNGTDGYRRPRMSLHLTAFDDAVSAGGGGSVFGSRGGVIV